MNVVLGVTGSIGAYKSADLVRRLRDEGCEVTCVLTREACEFITPLTLQVLSGRKAHTELFSREEAGVIHTTLADQAQLLLIAPATAQIIAKLAHGFADDLLSCIALATKAPVLLAPAMNVYMYEHPAVQENIRRLKSFGHKFVGPEEGPLACGYDAVGHVAEVEAIVLAALAIVSPSAKKRADPKHPASSPRRSR